MRGENVGKFNTFRERLRLARSRARLTQTELANKIGVSQVLISQYEMARSHPSFETLKLLAEALNVSADWLIGLSDERLISNGS